MPLLSATCNTSRLRFFIDSGPSQHLWGELRSNVIVGHKRRAIPRPSRGEPSRCSRRLLFHRIVTAHVATNGTNRATRAYSCSAYIALDAGGFALGNGGRNIDCTVLRSRLRATAWICETRDSSTPS